MSPEQISRMTDPQRLRVLMRNAERLGRPDVKDNAFRRLCALEGVACEDALERDFYTTLNAYEELLTEKNGRTTKASRTRQKLQRKGPRKCLADWALGHPTDGFHTLVERGMWELTGEYLVVKHHSQFEPHVVRAARERLNDIGCVV